MKLLRAGVRAEGAVVATVIPNRVTGSQANTDLIRRYRERFGRNPGFWAPAGYVAAFTWFEGARRAKSFESGAVSATLHAKTFTYDSMIGVISYDGHGDLTEQRLYPQVIRDGHLEPLT